LLIENMARDLGLTTRFIVNLANGASHEYRTYWVEKRTGGFRQIHHPSRRLKALQRWLLANVLQVLPVHDAAAAYRKGRSIFDNAAVHAPNRYLLRMDVTDFFPSIMEADIERYASERPAFFPGWTDADRKAFRQLLCRHHALTIGAPTSPAVSNAICYDLDVHLHAPVDKERCAIYTLRRRPFLFVEHARRPSTTRARGQCCR
jgi:RNA-directed DNA polymerase